MASVEAAVQKQRLMRLAGARWPSYEVIFDEPQSQKFRFGLQHRTNGKRSGRSTPSAASGIRDKDDASIVKLMQLMIGQCER